MLKLKRKSSQASRFGRLTKLSVAALPQVVDRVQGVVHQTLGDGFTICSTFKCGTKDEQKLSLAQ